MNEAHLHLLVNHLPIILPVAGLGILLAGLVFRSGILKRTAYILFMITALSAAAAAFSGEGAEEMVEDLPGVEHALIEAHEDAAGTFAILAYVLGAVSVLAFWASYARQPFEGLLAWLTAILAAVALFFAFGAGNSGGLIRHPEIETNAVTPHQEEDH